MACRTDSKKKRGTKQAWSRRYCATGFAVIDRTRHWAAAGRKLFGLMKKPAPAAPVRNLLRLTHSGRLILVRHVSTVFSSFVSEIPVFSGESQFPL